MKFSYNILQDLVSKKLPPAEKLAELLTMHSVEVEGVTVEGSDYILDLDILPNRAHDLVGHAGVAREVAVLVGGTLKLPKFFDITTTNKIKELNVEVKDSKLCTRYMAAFVRDVKVGKSPAWLKDRLEALGLNSINNVVDAANYAMLVTGQPLHAFDADNLTDNKIIIRKAKNGEKITTLDNENYKLSDEDLIIADEKFPLAIAGIKGGKKAEVDVKTTNLVLESANFNAISIRNTAHRLNIHTDASYRFEHGIPLTFAQDGVSYLMQLIKEVAGGIPQKEVISVGSKNQRKVVISIRPDYASKLLGEKLAKQKIISILKSLEFGVTSQKDKLKIVVPSFRLDIEREEDLVEEVGRIYGYENIKPLMPTAAFYPSTRNVKNYWVRQIKNYLSSRGFNEVYNYSFVGEDIIEAWGFNKKELWELENPLSQDFKYLRPSLLPQTLEKTRDNLRFFNDVQTFEFGEVFRRVPRVGSPTSGASESTRLCIAMGEKSNSKETFYVLKGYVESMFNALGISDVWFNPEFTPNEQKQYPYLHPSRSAQVKLGNDTVGFIGQIKPHIADKYKLKGRLFIADFDATRLTQEAEEESIYTPISSYPQVVRDVSLIVPVDAKTSDVMEVVDIAGGELLRDVDLFDYYEAEDISGTKSLAFHLIFQSDKNTLKSQDIDKLMDKIYKEAKFNKWEIK